MLKNVIRVKRAEHELTQTDLAQTVGVTRQTIAFIEKGEFSPSITLSLKLAAALKTPIAELFWIEKEGNEKTI